MTYSNYKSWIIKLKLYGKNIDNNATHGSDAPETATQEIEFFFPKN